MNKNIKIFDLSEQYKSISKKVNKNILNILKSGQYILGKNVIELEDKFSKFIGSKYSISCNSGTDALVLSLRALDIGHGDEVITSPFTYFATAEAIVLVGAKPIFADIDPRTFNIDYHNIEKYINKKTKAIIPVHLFGQSAEIIHIKRLCTKYGLKLIEDCAQSFGSTKHNKYTGTFGDFGCFSFFPTKNLGCAGDGGMITTDSLSKMKKLKKLRNHGGLVRNIHEYIGYNSRLDEIQASVILTKMEIIAKLDKKRNHIAKLYGSLIDNKFVTIPYKTEDESHHVYNQYTIKVKNRAKFTKYLQSNSIPFGIYYPMPIYKQKALNNFKYKCNLKNTEEVTKQCVSIPIYPELKKDAIKHISNVINKYK